MRVGLFRPVAPEVIAVGYTFEHVIFERLLERAPTSKHEFVVFEDLDGDKATGKTPNLKETPRKRPFSAKQLYAKLRSILELRTRFPDRPIDGKMSGLAIAWCAKDSSTVCSHFSLRSVRATN